MSSVTYRDGIATITTRTSKIEVDVDATAHLIQRAEVSPTAADTIALATGYLHLDAENKALRGELEAARAGTIGKEHAEEMHGARKVIAELRQAGEAFFEVYDQGDAPDSGLDTAFRDKLGEADHWLLCDVRAAGVRAKLLKGGAA
jgi:hypothetical protein